MKSFNSLYSDFGTITANTTTANTTFGKKLINDTQRIVLAYADWPFLEMTGTATSVASQNNYQLPAKMRKIINVKMVVGTTTYRPKPVEDPNFWLYLQSLSTSDSDAIKYYYREGNEVKLWPAPATASYTITIRGRKRWRDLIAADYTTGTIAAMTNADETVTGTGTPAWTGIKPVDTRWLKPTPTSGDGDGEWYEISSITSDTELELVKPYEGTTFTGKTVAYTIGEFSIIPSEYHDLLLWRACAVYFMQNNQDLVRAGRFWRMYDGGYEAKLDGPATEVGGLMKVMMEAELGKVEGAFMEPSEKTADDLGRFKIDSVSGESW